MPRFDLDAALGSLPIFPLPQVVLFPRARLPLHVFEARYRKMLADCLATHGVMAVARLPDPSDTRIDPIAGVGYVAEHEPLPDGRSNIVLVGLERVRLEELPFEAPYRRARAVLLKTKDARVTDNDRAALVAAATAFIAAMKTHDEDFGLELPRSLDPAALADICAHHLVISPEVRQEALAELDPSLRVAIVTRELALQRATLARSGRDLN